MFDAEEEHRQRCCHQVVELDFCPCAEHHDKCETVSVKPEDQGRGSSQRTAQIEQRNCRKQYRCERIDHPKALRDLLRIVPGAKGYVRKQAQRTGLPSATTIRPQAGSVKFAGLPLDLMGGETGDEPAELDAQIQRRAGVGVAVRGAGPSPLVGEGGRRGAKRRGGRMRGVGRAWGGRASRTSADASGGISMT